MMEEKELAIKAQALMEKLDREAQEAGYNLNPDAEAVLFLCQGLVANTERYGYMNCPCRLGSGDMDDDLDIICPCDYRDTDLDQYGVCYCALYVSQEVVDGKKEEESIPERRPTDEDRKKGARKNPEDRDDKGIKVYRCKVCGYLCARENPPQKCPICKASKERFEEFGMERIQT